jgi:hypothetical protein
LGADYQDLWAMDSTAKIIYGEHMMKGQINCKFIGGKQGEFNLT